MSKLAHLSPLTSNLFLYLDTSEPETFIRIYQDNRVKVEKRWLAHRELSATLSGKYQELLLESVGIDFTDEQLTVVQRPKHLQRIQQSLAGIVVFVGPGSFTGLRIGISFANALAYALGIPIYETKQRDELDLSDPKQFAIPNYGGEPHITKPKDFKKR